MYIYMMYFFPKAVPGRVLVLDRMRLLTAYLSPL